MDRASGWRFAKLDGHHNERAAGASLEEDFQTASNIVNWISGQILTKPHRVKVDGSSKVPTIHGDAVIGKIDLTIQDEDIEPVGVSVKKSNGGQVWLVSVDRFLEALGSNGSETESDDLVTGLRLFIGGSENLRHVEEIFSTGLRMSAQRGHAWHNLEIHQNRLAMESIKLASRTVYEELIDFFKDNISVITHLCFASGSASRREDHAQGVLYNNAPGGAQVFNIEMLERELISSAHKISPGPRNGGTTIWLPFGFLQMHKPQGKNLMQFHHKLDTLQESAPNSCKKL